MSQSPLFPFEKVEPTPKRLADMHKAYGKIVGTYCGTCAHFIRYAQATRWAKCNLTTQTSGAATDWHARWEACGQWQEAVQ